MISCFARSRPGTPLGRLSDGERARPLWPAPSSVESNLLMIDEPTNDLDLETLDLLQEQLAEYPGTVLLVSHDRDFPDRVVTSTIATDGNGLWIEYVGGYTDMLAQRAGDRAVRRQRSETPNDPDRQRKPANYRRSLPRRMNFNDRRALDLLSAQIGVLEARITELNQRHTTFG